MVTCPDWFFFEILRVQIYRRAAAQAKLSLLVLFVQSDRDRRSNTVSLLLDDPSKVGDSEPLEPPLLL